MLFRFKILVKLTSLSYDPLFHAETRSRGLHGRDPILVVSSNIYRGVLDRTLCDKVCQ